MSKTLFSVLSEIKTVNSIYLKELNRNIKLSAHQGQLDLDLGMVKFSNKKLIHKDNNGIDNHSDEVKRDLLILHGIQKWGMPFKTNWHRYTKINTVASLIEIPLFMHIDSQFCIWDATFLSGVSFVSVMCFYSLFTSTYKDNFFNNLDIKDEYLSRRNLKLEDFKIVDDEKIKSEPNKIDKLLQCFNKKIKIRVDFE